MERFYNLIITLLTDIATLDYFKMIVFTIFAAYVVKVVRGYLW